MGIVYLNIAVTVICCIGFVLCIYSKDKLLAFIQVCFILLNAYMGISGYYKIINKEKISKQNIENIQPTAKDVYDGKTTLRIVYENYIPIDTQIVFKKEFVNNKVDKK